VITEEEAKAMIDSATSARDKAGEALGMRVSDVAFDENGARVSVRGKTGSRTVLLITSAPILGLYLQQHPFKGGDGPLWIHFGTWKKYQRMSYQATRETLIRIARRAGIRKRVHPHLFRHSAATRDGGYNISERILELKFGWAKGSKMAARYTHLQDARIADSIFLSTYAGKEIRPPEPEFRPLRCPKCSEKNTVGMKYCGRCGCPLEGPDLAARSAEIESLKSQVSEIRSLLERVLSQAQK
jgi:hypothetical protein